VRFTYDLNGVLEVEAVVVETQKKISLVIAKHARGLSAEQVARAVSPNARSEESPPRRVRQPLLTQASGSACIGELPLNGARAAGRPRRRF